MRTALRWLFAATATAGLLLTTGAAVVLAIAHDWASFTAAYVGIAIIAASALGFNSLDRKVIDRSNPEK